MVVFVLFAQVIKFVTKLLNIKPQLLFFVIKER